MDATDFSPTAPRAVASVGGAVSLHRMQNEIKAQKRECAEVPDFKVF
jgi:hypothetical protein